MNYFFVTGETSGDQIAAKVAEKLLHNRGHQVFAWGGASLRAAGATIKKDISDLSSMGSIEVIGSLLAYPLLISQVKRDITDARADVVVLVDYGSFNLRVARWAKNRGYQVVYISPPKVWASRPGRISTISSSCDIVIVMFPFEKKFYRTHGVSAEFFGHPLAQRIAKGKNENGCLGIIPGSRRQEVRKLLPVMLKAFRKSAYTSAVVSCAPGIDESFIRSLIPRDLTNDIRIDPSPLQHTLMSVDVAVVTSGTATMLCSLAMVPQVVCYRTSTMTYQIAKRIINVDFISLVNLMMNQRVVPELVQSSCNPDNILQALGEVIENKASILRAYHDINEQLYHKDAISSIVKAIS